MNAIAARFEEMFSWRRISHYLVEDLLPDVIMAILVFAFFYGLYRILRKILRAGLAHSALDKTARSFIEAVLKYIVLAIGVVSTLSQLGVDTGGLLTSLGVVGLTIGFAARDTLSNVISGLFIFWDRPFVVDDLVEVGDKYGRVVEITMRSTRVVTVDGRMLAVPNSTIVNSTVASYTNFPNLRLDVPVTIGPGEDLTRVRKILTGLVEQDERFLQDPKPTMVVKAINDYNLEVELRAWLANERDHLKMRFDLRERVFEALRTASVDMPLETVQLAPFEVRSTATG